MNDGIPPALSASIEKAVNADDCPEWVRLLLTLLMTFIESVLETQKSLHATIAELRAEVERLRKAPFTSKSERGGTPKTSRTTTPKPPKEPREPRTGPPALDSAPMQEQVVEHSVPPEDLTCPVCSGHAFDAMPPDESTEYELVIETLKRLIHRRQKLACRCGEHIVTAPGPARVTDGGRFGPHLHSWVLVRRCMDAIPINRMGDILRQAGTPIATSTLNDLFHVATEKLRPLHTLIQQRVKLAHVIHADETPQRVLAPKKCETGYLWVFTSHEDVLMLHRASRSGETPVEVLGESTGFLVADAFTGYNKSLETKNRKRQGCLAHSRRKYCEALEEDPERARWVIGHLALLYAIEAQVQSQNLERTPEHAVIRDTVCRPIMDNIRAWLDEQKPVVRPKRRIGTAVAYMDRQWARLTLFLDHPELPLDNNPAERELRRPVLGRKTSLFVGNHECGERYAIGFSLVMTCRKIGVDPIKYLAWVLPKIDEYPNRRLEELLPHAFKALHTGVELRADL